MVTSGEPEPSVKLKSTPTRRPARSSQRAGLGGEVAAIETTMAAAAQKLAAMHTARDTPVLLGMPVLVSMPDTRSSAGRSSAG
jgi:hypothetical protein